MADSRLTVKDLDEIEAQIDSTVPYYVPALIKEIRRLRAEGAEGSPPAAGECQKHGDPLVCLACEAEEDARPEWRAPQPHRVTPPRLRGEPPREQHRCSGCGHRWEDSREGFVLRGAELCGDCWRKGQAVILGEGAESEAVPVQHEHKFDSFTLCRICIRTEADVTGDCHHCGDYDSIRNGRCWWCLRKLRGEGEAVPPVQK